MKSGTLFAYFVTFSASFCIMVIELVAGRILAPYIGQHLYSWTSIIGICLAGISVGAWLGGWLADKFPYRATLGWFLFFAGILSLCIPLMTDAICTRALFKGDISLMTRIVLYTTLIFFPVTMVLGMISPMVIKLVVRDLANTGSVVGRIYSFSTIGSILGTFATGFFLIEEFGTRVLLYAVGIFLIVIAPLAGGLFGSGTKYVGLFLALLALGTTTAGAMMPGKYVEVRDDLIGSVGQPMQWKSDRKPIPAEVAAKQTPLKNLVSNYFDFYHEDASYWKESNYFTLRVIKDIDKHESRPVNLLILDNLIHSHTDLDDPSYLSYEYLRIYDELVSWKLARQGSTKHRELFIGGGGYTLQRYFHHLYKDSHIDVVEIDPYVTYLAEEYMGAPRGDKRLVTKNEDGRLFVMDKQKTDDRYDFIFGDAFNDLSVPFHLTTEEFDTQMKNLLTKQGLVMSLVIDDVARGLFLPSFIATMRKSFGDENVVLILVGSAKGRDRITNYLKKYNLDKYIPDLSTKTLEEVIATWDKEKLKSEIAFLKSAKVNELAPYLKATNLDYVSGQDTVIVVGSKEPQNWDDFNKHLADLDKKYDEEKKDKSTTSNVIRPAALTEYLKTRTRLPTWWEKLTKGEQRVPWTPVVLTDDHAPVDNLLAPLFEQRFGYKKPVGKKAEGQDEKDLVDELLEMEKK
jgi:spermidine synthase